MISIRKKIINAAIKCRIARDNYQSVDSAMINHNCKEYKLWLKATDKAFDLICSEEGLKEINTNGVITQAEVEEAYNKKMKK
jgi:hypothetical protein